MEAAALDYRFAWRWLAPLPDCASVFVGGFGDRETAFWHGVLAARAVPSPAGEAQAWIVDADQVPPGELARARAICAVGSARALAPWRRAVHGRFAQVREYGLLPRDNPRVVVPLTPRHAGAGLRLHRPGRRMARAALRLAACLARAHILAPLRHRSLLVAARDADAVPSGAVEALLPEWLGEAQLDYALYLGTADDNRKTVVLPLGAGAPHCIVKVAATPRARQSLRNEAAALDGLRRSAVARNVPRVLGRVESGSTLAVYQQYRVRRAAGARLLEDAVVDFLARLCAIGVSHGDFTPWNCAWTDEGLLVYDWEASTAAELPLGDAFHYVLGTALHLGNCRRPRQTLQQALALAARVADAAAMQRAQPRAQLAAWLRQRLPQAAFYGTLLGELEGRP